MEPEPNQSQDGKKDIAVEKTEEETHALLFLTELENADIDESDEEQESEDQLIGLLKKYDLPVELKTPLSVESLKNAMMNDKKVQKGTLRFIVMEKIGKACVEDSIDLEQVIEVLESVGAH